MGIPKLKLLAASVDNPNMGKAAEVIESFYLRCRLIGCTEKTHAVYAERLGCLLRYAESVGKRIESLGKADIERYVASQLDRVAAVTINGRLQAWRTLYRHLKSEGFVDVDPTEGVRKLREPQVIRSVLTPDDMARVLSKVDRRAFCGARNYALILLTFDAMLRLGEALSIRLADVEPRSGTLKVLGKGRKERVVAFSALTAKALHTYVSRFRVKVGGDLLFCTRTGTRIPRRHAHRIFDRAARKAGLRLNPHLARHSGATAFARSGGSIAVLQRALGHANLSTTQQYLHITGDDVHDAYARHAPAYGIRS
jgi:integrase/recombinase XerD